MIDNLSYKIFGLEILYMSQNDKDRWYGDMTCRLLDDTSRDKPLHYIRSPNDSTHSYITQ